MYRRVDSLGRIVIPKKIRKTLEIKNGDLFEFFVNNDSDAIILSRRNETIGIGSLGELVRRLSKEFSNIKDDLDVEISNQISTHINALLGIFKGLK